MSSVTNRQIRLLRPFLVGDKPKRNGEWDMHCPLHEDAKRSASLNVITGDWYCFACEHGGGIEQLIAEQASWLTPGRVSMNGSSSSRQQEIISEAKIKAWLANLMSNTDESLDWLMAKRGLSESTLARYEIGWDAGRRVYTIPVRGHDGEIWNLRRYNPSPADDKSKMYNVAGMRATELYPVSILKTAREQHRVIVGEGEWDVLATIQHGYPAITRTGAARVWMSEWGENFRDMIVYICHDADHTGQIANRKIARALLRLASEVRIVSLPYKIERNHGKDLSDFWLEHAGGDFERMLSDAQLYQPKQLSSDPEIVTVLDSFDAQHVGVPVKLQVTIKGKKDPGYTLPRKALLTCTRDAGAICNFCPMNPAGGSAAIEIPPSSPAILGLIDSPAANVKDVIRDEYGAMKCKRLTIEIEEHQAVEILFARPSIDHADGTQARDYKNIKVTSAGRYDTMPNNTVIATGALYPNPRDQRNEFLAWDIAKQETSVDKFEITPAAIKMMKMFQIRKGQRPLAKLIEINRDFAEHVTQIIGRPELHALIDLTFHSILSFKLGREILHRGWLESLVVGDTRTGKSKVATNLIRHFGAGEIVGGEGATLAGLVGGMQQMGGRDWVVTWGVVPLNDRRLVVIDELSGLSPEDISKMSDVRASGMARLTKIVQEVTFARTRLIWLGNPRDGGMDQFTYGVDAVQPLIGNPEDIARFDLAMAVSLGDISSDSINTARDAGTLRFTSEACHTLLMWAWTRGSDNVILSSGVHNLILAAAKTMGRNYVEYPPLVQAANIREKIARVAVALAARTFSTDQTYENVVVNKEHVDDAVAFINHLYAMPSFGYAERSAERLQDLKDAKENVERVRKYLLERRGLAKFLRSNPRFRRQDIEEIMNYDREGANGIINHLWEARMIRKEGADCRVEPTLHDLLRQVSW